MEPIKQASPWIMFVGQILGFTSIYLIGRPGELVRPAYIAKKENVSFTAMVAVWLLERIFDITFMVLLFAVALSTMRGGQRTLRGDLIVTQMQKGGWILLALTVLVVVALVAYRSDAESLRVRLLRRMRFLPPRALSAVGHFLSSFADGLGVIRSARSFAASVASTALLWTLNVTVLWLVFRALGPELDHLSWLAGALVLFFGALGLIVQIPGVGGGFQVAMILALTELFAVSAELATGAAVLVWVIVSAPCLALGLILLGYEGLTFKKLEAIAAAARAAGQEEAR